ncbi:Alcohol acetyltransferase [Venustampulla echinocandica]|uniref:Alcohol acetyltransferase n=1 Tax=Venustampulla echinocandica TaxID=2656787 RepID=A0A370U1T0_9HELO|nr:Alcohol acetyltransferase [Venustampulla echinocandica]RDL41703.1 Alcohol acetyltransferase [Venustampulla echinocandica]
MSEKNAFQRFASEQYFSGDRTLELTGTGPNERRTISREDLGFYNAVVVSAVYEFAGENIDVKSVHSFVQPLNRCIEEHPHLTVVIKDAHTEKPYYESVSNINLADHVFMLGDDEARDDDTATLEKILPPILDQPWPPSVPPWRIVVLSLPPQRGTKIPRCLIAFAFSHTIGDGIAGLAFHRTFLDACQLQTTTNEETFMFTVPRPTLPAPFDTPQTLPISWSFLLGPLIAVLLPKFIANFLGLHAAASTVDAGTWTGSPIFFNPGSLYSKIRLLEIEGPLVKKALQVSRTHDAKLTGTIHQLIVRALSKALPDRNITNFVSGTAINMRGSVGAPNYEWGLYVSGYYEAHPRVDAATGLTDAMWAAASSMTKNLAECAVTLQDQAIGLLRYAPSIRNWTLGKIGDQRDSSYEVSNLLVFDGSGEGKRSRITKMVFAQPGNTPSAPLVFNLVSVKGGSMMCAVSWQEGALGIPLEQETAFVDEIILSLRADFEGLGNIPGEPVCFDGGSLNEADAVFGLK